MKKRNILVSLLLVLALMITACGEPSPFIGSWRGAYDLTDIVIESIVAGNEDLQEYVGDIDNLTFAINFEFTEDKMSISVDDASVDAFIENLENGMKNMMDIYLQDQLQASGISYEEYLLEEGMEADEFLQSQLDEMGMTAQTEAMMSSLAESLELSGAYMFDDEILTIVYEDNTYEEMKYVFDGDVLTITFVDGEGVEIPIICEKQ